MDVIRTGISAFLLREQPFERFRFSRWQSRFVITLLGVLQGLAMHMHVHALKASDLALPHSVGKGGLRRAVDVGGISHHPSRLPLVVDAR